MMCSVIKQKYSLIIVGVGAQQTTYAFPQRYELLEEPSGPRLTGVPLKQLSSHLVMGLFVYFYRAAMY